MADGAVGISGEGATVGLGDRHFGEHAHYQHHQRAGDQIGNQYGRAGFGDGVAGADEQAGTDGAGDGEHGDVTIFQALREPGGRGTTHALPIQQEGMCGGGKRCLFLESNATCAIFYTKFAQYSVTT
ncbi:hypothetical protein D3C81_1674520 [compost metagenome]